MVRLRQIAIQAAGPRALQDSEVASTLGLTDEQKEKITEINRDLRNGARDAMGGGDRAAAAKKMADLRKGSMDKVMGVFTDEQKTKWNEMTGEPFKGELQFGRGGFGGGGGPGGGRRGGGPGGASSGNNL